MRDLQAAVRAVDALRRSHPWIDLQGLDEEDCEVVARAALHAVFPSVKAWEPLPDERVDTKGK